MEGVAMQTSPAGGPGQADRVDTSKLLESIKHAVSHKGDPPRAAMAFLEAAQAPSGQHGSLAAQPESVAVGKVDMHELLDTLEQLTSNAASVRHSSTGSHIALNTHIDTESNLSTAAQALEATLARSGVEPTSPGSFMSPFANPKLQAGAFGDPQAQVEQANAAGRGAASSGARTSVFRSPRTSISPGSRPQFPWRSSTSGGLHKAAAERAGRPGQDPAGAVRSPVIRARHSVAITSIMQEPGGPPGRPHRRSISPVLSRLRRRTSNDWGAAPPAPPLAPPSQRPALQRLETATQRQPHRRAWRASEADRFSVGMRQLVQGLDAWEVHEEENAHSFQTAVAAALGRIVQADSARHVPRSLATPSGTRLIPGDAGSHSKPGGRKSFRLLCSRVSGV